MSISIRAGLLSSLCAQELNKINNRIVQDILYINNCLKHLIEYSYYYFIRTTFRPGENSSETTTITSITTTIANDGDTGSDTTNINVNIDTANIYKTVFPIFASEFKQRLLEDGFTDKELPILLDKFMDMKDICASSGFLVVDNWVTSAGRQGVIYEQVAIQCLHKLGFVVSEGVHSSKDIAYNGTTVQLNGRPDGVIVSSPGNSITPGTVVEIKYRNRNSYQNKWRDELQLCAYGVIFEVDVLYVVIYNDKLMECTLYRNNRLLDLWNSKKHIILGNSLKLHKLITSYCTDSNSASELIELARYK